jgi:hypothetical protein
VGSPIKKARLESVKTELEIREKQGDLASRSHDEAIGSAAEIIAQSLFEGQRFQNLVLRLIVIFMVITVWSLVRQTFGILYDTTRLGLAAALGDPVVDQPALIALWVAVHG